MKATSVQTIENVKEMHFTIEKSGVDEITKVIVGASTNDDIFEFHFSGNGCVVFADQWFNAMAEKAYKVDFESERNKRKMMETENSILRKHLKDVEDKLETANKQLIQENKDLKKRYDRLNKKFNRVMNDNLPETPITDTMLVDDYLKLTKEIEKLTIEKAMLKDENEKLEKELGEWKKEAADCLRLRDEVRREKNKEINNLKWQLQDKSIIIKRNDELKKELTLEKAANEAQHKFIREYAGKGTEVQFNYAIDDAKEVSYVIVDRKENERIKENLQSQHKMILELNKANCENCDDEEVVDNVNHPSHYTGRYECIDVMQDVFGDEATDNFCLCNAFKYIWRARKKNELEDVKKAVWYLNKYIEEAEKDGVPKGK